MVTGSQVEFSFHGLIFLVVDEIKMRSCVNTVSNV